MFSATTLLLALAAEPAAATTETPAPATRSLAMTYEVRVPLAEGAEPIQLFLPVPTSDAQQVIANLKVDGPVAGSVLDISGTNRVWHASLPAATTPATVVMTFDVTRHAERADLSAALPRALDDEERVEHAAFLAASELVPVGDVEALKPLLADVRASRASEAPLDTARAIFDWVSTRMTYKKEGTGWGNGDTFWACSSLYGNCTDFHSVFLSLARTEGIPGAFEMGFPVPLDRPEGSIGGYHCWVRFWVPGTGWIPIDASEAAKNPAARESLFGAHPADRVRFTVGRDLRLGPAHRGPSLNYFIYPYAERGGVPWDEDLELSVSYDTLP